MKILSIGNSFSQDATRYLHALAKSAGESIKTVNLYIGGCSLEQHAANIREDKKAYSFEFNGERTGLTVSVKEALESDEWDYVTLQQQSARARDYATYEPYLTELAAYVRDYAPHAKLLMHQTWAYEDGSELLKNLGLEKASDMLCGIVKSYEQAAQSIGAAGIIPCGKAMYAALSCGLASVHRDTFHASLGAGRFLLALTWYGYLTGADVAAVSFRDFDEPVSESDAAIVKKAAAQVLAEH